MKKYKFSFLIVAICLIGLPVFSQADKDTTALLGLPGDNLDLYAVLTLFQKSKTIEEFEKTLNDEKTKINNLDLNLDKKVDFIKVVTTKEKDSYTFTLQVDVTKTETQDVASILVDKDKNGKVSLQIVGAEELYGKDYVVEPKGNSSVTANPAYTGSNPVTKDVPATTTVVVQSAPIIQYVYSPVYVPYVPPYYYGFYPPYFAFGAAIAVGIYRSNCWGYHGGYYGGHYGGGNTVIINNGNRNNINHNRSTTVSNNMAKGSYGGNRGTASNRQSNGSNRPSTGTSASNRQSTGSNRPSTGASASTRQSGGSNRPSTSNYSSSNRASNNSMGSSRTRSSGGSGFGGGGFGGGGSRGGGGMSRGGGGGRRR